MGMLLSILLVVALLAMILAAMRFDVDPRVLLAGIFLLFVASLAIMAAFPGDPKEKEMAGNQAMSFTMGYAAGSSGR